MFKAHRHLPALLAAAVLMAAPACASRGGLYRYPSSSRATEDRAYRNGYDEGRRAGESDAQRGRAVDYNRHNEYRDADNGYRGGVNRDGYRQVFRRGFVDGYEEGYRRYARNGNAYPQRVPGGFGNGGPNPRYGSRSPAAQSGYRDGYEQGRHDGRDGDRYDPVRASRYRSGDHDYNNRYGSRDEYKREYRTAFEQGYEQGYRENRRR
jgi:flagellar biosynthesis/type III secretory pathway protein FliH